MSLPGAAEPHRPPGACAAVFDVDGVVSAVHPASDGAWGDEVTAGHLFGPVRVSPALCRRLDDLGTQPHVMALWLTSWPAESRERMDPFPGRDWATLATPDYAGQSPADSADPDRLDWWKWDALRTWLAAHRNIRSLVWCEDHLALPLWDEEDDPDDAPPPPGQARPWPYASALDPDDAPFLTTIAELVAARLAEMGVKATLVAPDTAVGLTPEDLDRVEAAVAASRPS